MDYDEGEGGCYDDLYDDTSVDPESLIDWDRQYWEEMYMEMEKLDDAQECWGEKADCVVIYIEGIRTCVTHNNPYEEQK